jgi:Cof subfamily protein (haloacid dehalogenase superfamily)
VIDLVALDLDGTLFDPSERISPASRAAILDCLRAGVRVVVVTGRGVETPLEIARELGLNLPLICAHGALTVDAMTGKVLGHIPVPLVHAKPMIEFAETNELDAAVYSGQRFYRLKGARRYMDDMHGPHWSDVGSFAEILHEAPTFLRFFGAASARAVRETFGDLPLHFKFESWGEFEELAVTSLDATKKHALERLCADLQIGAKNVLAIGDSRNDVPMLQWAGVGVAMGNALPEVRRAVEHVTDANDEDGVARAIERFVLRPLAEEEKSA